MFTWLKNWFTRKSPNHRRQIHFSFDGQTITAAGLLAQKTSVRVENIHEIGIETTDLGPFVEDVFWLINRETDALRVPQDSPVFKELMVHFESIKDFDWQPFTEAMSCTDCRYFLCWKKSAEPSQK